MNSYSTTPEERIKELGRENATLRAQLAFKEGLIRQLTEVDMPALESQLATAIESNDGLRAEFVRVAMQKGIAESQLATAQQELANAKKAIAYHDVSKMSLTVSAEGRSDTATLQAATPVGLDAPDSVKQDIGLCAAAVVLAYYRKTHDHILADDDTINAAMRVEHFLGRR